MNDVHVSDPHHVPETLISGPVNIKRMGGFLLITLTSARENVSEVFAGKQKAEVEAIVVSRLLVPVELASQLPELINKSLGNSPPPPRQN